MSEKFDQFKYQNAYNKEKYDRVTAFVPKGVRSKMKQRASDLGMSLNKYIIAAVTNFDSELRGDFNEDN